MLKDLTKSMKWISIILLLVVCVFIVYNYSNDKGRILDKMSGRGGFDAMPMSNLNLGTTPQVNMPSVQNAMNFQASPPPMMSQPQQMAPPSVPLMQPSSAPSTDSGFGMQPVANPADLLPQDQNSQWANLNPINGSVPVPVDLLQAGYQIGLDTIGQTLKNPNYQLRSDPIIEKKDIGPWMQSTIEPDYGRIPLEIGYGGR